jgi:tetratricopeptide (TPR) repeat protein
MNPAQVLAPAVGALGVEAIYATGHWLLSCERVAEAATVFRVMLRTAPADERGWLGLGECHERIDQPRVALQLYGAGSVIAGRAGTGSVRCLLARARVLSRRGDDAEAEAALEAAEQAAVEDGDERLAALVLRERRGSS